MGLAEVQKALARLAIEPALRARFFADPGRAGIELGLGAEDAQGLARIPQRQLEQFAESLDRKRRDQVRRVIPMAARALGEQFAALFERYVAASPPRGSKPGLDDAAGFVAALGRSTALLDPPWAADLARYELAWREAARVGRVPLVRFFRFPIARLATPPPPEPVAPWPCVAFWWRPTRRGPIRHLLLSAPGRSHADSRPFSRFRRPK